MTLITSSRLLHSFPNITTSIVWISCFLFVFLFISRRVVTVCRFGCLNFTTGVTCLKMFADVKIAGCSLPPPSLLCNDTPEGHRAPQPWWKWSMYIRMVHLVWRCVGLWEWPSKQIIPMSLIKLKCHRSLPPPHTHKYMDTWANYLPPTAFNILAWQGVGTIFTSLSAMWLWTQQNSFLHSRRWYDTETCEGLRLSLRRLHVSCFRSPHQIWQLPPDCWWTHVLSAKVWKQWILLWVDFLLNN